MTEHTYNLAGLPPIDIEEALRHCCCIDPRDVRHIFLAAHDPKGQNEKARQFYGRLPEFIDELNDLQRKGYGVFIAVNEMNGSRRKNDQLKRVRAVHRDLDQDPPQDLPLSPSLTVETSPGRQQDYFFTADDDPLTREEAECINLALASEYGGDLNAKDVARVLRLAGSFHLKNEPYRVSIVGGNNERYTRDQLLKAFPPPTETVLPSDNIPTFKHSDRYVSVAINGVLEDLANAQEKTRNSSLNKAAFRLAQLGVPSEQATNLLKPIANDIGLEEHEIIPTIKSGWTAGRANPRNDQAFACAETSEVGIAANELQPWPQLPSEALYGLAGEIVEAATENSEADPAAVLATLLTHAGICAGRGVYIRVGDDFHHARLFNVLVGQSARGRKGTSEGPVRRIGERVDEIIGPLAWRPGPMSTGEGLIFAIRDGDDKEDGDPGVRDKRLLIVEGEFGSPLRAMQRQGNTLSTVIRVAWDGKTLEPLTKTSFIRASDPHIGIVGHITEQELKSLLGQVDIFNGFANRFLWWCVRRSKPIPLATGMDEVDVIRFGDEYGKRLQRAQQLGEVKFSPEARALYEHIYPDLTADQEGVYGIVVARAEAQVIRIALTFAVIGASPVITADHLEAAMAVWDYCDASAKYLYWKASANPLENRILDALVAGPLDQAGLHRALGGHTAAAELKTALQNLQGRGRIDCKGEKTGGRPKRTWELRAGFDTASEARKANKDTVGDLSSENSLRSQTAYPQGGSCRS